MGTARAPGHAPYGKPGDPDSKIFERYAEWHTRVLAEDCSKAQMLVWTASAGFGDSVNALTAAFNIALQTERLFFADWRNTNAALDSPPFLWRWDDFLASHPTRTSVHCSRRSVPTCVCVSRLWAAYKRRQVVAASCVHCWVR